MTDAPAGRSILELDFPVVELLRQHALWVQTGGAKGTKIDLSGYDLRPAFPLDGITFTAIKATGVILYGMKMPGIEMQFANMDRGDLRACDLSRGDLRGISLRGAMLNMSNMAGREISATGIGGWSV